MSWINQGKLQPKSLQLGRKERPWKHEKCTERNNSWHKRIKRKVGRGREEGEAVEGLREREQGWG
jgi:hypothetical protein